MLKTMTEERRILRHESTIRRAVWSPLIALGVLVVSLLSLAYYFYDTARWVQHSSDNLYLASRALRFAIDMETGSLGFFSGGDPEFLKTYDEANAVLVREKLMEELVQNTGDNPRQQKRAKAIQDAFLVWKKEADKDISVWRNSPPSAFARRVDERTDKSNMDRVRNIQKEFIAEELQLKNKRILESDSVARFALLGGTCLTLFVGGFLALVTHKQMRDISEQYETVIETEARVRERLATTLTSIGDGVIVTDATGRVTLINPITESLTGWSNEDARGKNHREIFNISHEDTGEPVPSPIDQSIQENRTVLLANHTVLKHRNGSQIAIEDSAAPIRDKKGNINGVVLVFRDVTQRKKQDAELAVALEKNIRIAETLQRSMLTAPAKNAYPGFSVVTLYETAWDEAQVGGDFFDTFTFWDDQVALVVGDATGKGLVAAAKTSEVKYALRAYLYDDPSPAHALTRLNRLLHESQNDRRAKEAELLPFAFVSIAVAIVNSKTGEGTCAVAGAESPLLLRKDGTTQEAVSSGMMLGASTEAQYEEGTFVLQSGDLIAFTTDGITEARRGRREFFGYEGFTQVLQTSIQNKVDLDRIASRVMEEAKEYAGGKLKDDVCLLIAQRD